MRGQKKYQALIRFEIKIYECDDKLNEREKQSI